MTDISLPERQSPFMVDGAPLALMTGEELAAAMRYEQVGGAFRAWCQKLGITTVLGRNNLYDPKHVRARLDAAHLVDRQSAEPQKNLTHTQMRRARRGRK